MEPKLRVMDANALDRSSGNNAQLFMIKVSSAMESGKDHLEKEVIEVSSTVVANVLEEIQELFSEPQGLPPFRDTFDHHIPLVEGANQSIIDLIDIHLFERMLSRIW